MIALTLPQKLFRRFAERRISPAHYTLAQVMVSMRIGRWIVNLIRINGVGTLWGSRLFVSEKASGLTPSVQLILVRFYGRTARTTASMDKFETSLAVRS